MIKKIFPSEDAFISQYYANFNFSNAAELYFGINLNYIERSILSFDLLSLPQNIEISNAWINIFISRKDSRNICPAYLYIINQTFNMKYVTWNNQPDAQNTLLMTEISDSMIGSYVSINITDILKNAVSQNLSVLSLEIRGNENNIIGLIGFTDSNLTVEYLNKPQDFEITSRDTEIDGQKTASTYSVKNSGKKTALSVLQIKLNAEDSWCDLNTQVTLPDTKKVLTTNSANYENRISIIEIIESEISTSSYIVDVNKNINNIHNIQLAYSSSNPEAPIDSNGTVTFGTGSIQTTISISVKNIANAPQISFSINSNIVSSGVHSEAELLNALSDPGIGIIEFANSFPLSVPLVIGRNVCINGKGFTLSFNDTSLDKKITITCSSLIMKNITIAARIDINIPDDGTVIFDKFNLSAKNEIHVLHGGIHSIYFYGSTSYSLYIDWTTKVTLDADTSGQESLLTNIQHIYINYPPQVSEPPILQVFAAHIIDITVSSQAELELSGNETSVGTINVESTAPSTTISLNSYGNSPSINIYADNVTLTGSGHPQIYVAPSASGFKTDGCIIAGNTAAVSSSIGLSYAISKSNVNAINIGSGDYYEDFFEITRPIKVSGADYRDQNGNYISQTYLRPSQNTDTIIYSHDCQNTDLSWMTLDRNGKAGSAVIFIGDTQPNNGYVHDCKVVGTTGQVGINCYCALLALNGGENITFENNIVEGMIPGEYAAAIGAMWGCTGIVIKNNYIDGMKVQGNGVEGIVECDVSITGNTIANCNYCGVYENQSNLVIKNNTIYNNNYGIGSGAWTKTMRHNSVYNNIIAASVDSTFDATENYWGTSTPQTLTFEGDVIYSPYYMDPGMTILSVAVNKITVTGHGGISTVTVNSTLQMDASILPENATVNTITWSETDGTGKASIDQSGILTGIAEGKVTVTAKANDGSGVSASTIITITAAN